MKKALRIMLLTILICQLIKICFFIFNIEAFHRQLNEISFGQILFLVYMNVRMDISAICVLFVPVFMLMSIFLISRNEKTGKAVVFWGLILVSIPMFLINIADVGYYAYHQRRMNYDVFFSLGGALSDSLSWVKRYWFLIVAGIVFCSFFVLMLKRIVFAQVNENYTPRKKWVHLLIGFVLLCVGVRGLKARPIIPSTPLLYFNSSLQPLISNSTLSLIYSIIKNDEKLELKHWFNQTEVDERIPVAQVLTNQGDFKRKNIVLFVLESFSPEYFQNGNSFKTSTPFLDSIQEKSIQFSRFYANGLQSNEGLPSILLSIPAFQDIPYFHSRYANNTILPIGEILGRKGYDRMFFLGAGKDHFGFEKLAKLAGVNQYICADEYNNPQHHDGHWGISDHYFLPFAGRTLHHRQNPFFAVVYNLSTHPPFKVPADVPGFYSNYPEGSPQRSVAYADFSLRLFFDEIKYAPWYENTVFLFVPDHGIRSLLSGKSNELNSFEIPFFIHEPIFQDKKLIEKPVQQLDIVPGILDYLNYSGTVTSFGKSFLASTPSLIVQKYMNNYQLISDSMLLAYNSDLDSVMHFYKHNNGLLLTNNFSSDPNYDTEYARMLKDLKMFLQQYHNALIKNKMRD